MLRQATPSDLNVICKAFQARRDVFPHVRADYVRRACEQGRCFYDSGVVIIWQQYVKAVRLGDVTVPQGNVILHQILNATNERGTAAAVFQRFCEFVTSLGVNVNLYLTVRESNQRARRFYEKLGMRSIGRIAWAKGTIPGVIYAKFFARRPPSSQFKGFLSVFAFSSRPAPDVIVNGDRPRLRRRDA